LLLRDKRTGNSTTCTNKWQIDRHNQRKRTPNDTPADSKALKHKIHDVGEYKSQSDESLRPMDGLDTKEKPWKFQGRMDWMVEWWMK